MAKSETDPRRQYPSDGETRQMKCSCPQCGYLIRTTRKWLNYGGTPICPVEGHGRMIRHMIEPKPKNQE